MGLQVYRGPVPTVPDRQQWTWQHVLRTRAESHGDKVFLRVPDDGVELSYRATLDLATRIASQLFQLGAQPGDRVLIMATNSADCVLAGTSCVVSGLVEAPMNCEYKGAILEHQVQVVRPRFAIVDAEFVERFATRQAFESIEHFLVIGSEDERRQAQKQLADWGWPSTPFDEAKEASPRELPEIRSSDLCHIMFTSGTTGPSKGVRMPQAQSYLFAEEDVSLVRLTEDDVRMTAFPLFHGQAKFLSVLSAMLVGAELVLYRRFSAAAWLERVQVSQATVTNFVSGTMSMVWQQPPTDRDRENRLRCIFAAPTVAALVDGFKTRFDIETITEGYGQTEITLPILTPYGADRPPGAAGLVVADWFEIRVADSETDEEVPPGSLGELLVRSKLPWTLNDGYEGMTAKTLEAWRNLWFHTGDAVRMDEDGWVFFVDRVKDYLRRRGENISSFEVERALLEHPGIEECAVVGVPSGVAGGEDDIMAVVVPSPAGITPEEIWAWSEDRLPRFMVPQYVRIVTDLPKSAANRIQKHKLREAGAAGAASR